MCERKQYTVVLAHAATIHKTQGSKIDYMAGELDTTSKGGKHPCSVSRGLVYTLHSRTRRQDLIQILNFHEVKVKHNKESMNEKECTLRSLIEILIPCPATPYSLP